MEGATTGPATAPVSTGMWMPQQMVSHDVLALLRQDGLRLSAKDIYAINRRCATGAALALSVDNGLATPYASASFVSADGLVLTNFHCVNSYVQRLSKGDNDYLRYGCWASRREEEAPLFNLQVHQLLSVTDITREVLAGTDTMDTAHRDAIAEKRTRALASSSNEPYGVTRRVYSMMGNQQFVLARYRTFSDVRIVACPPLWLGGYGGDADNWRWPRYACDFAFLRVYVSPQGEPASYASGNVPYRPQSYLRLAQRSVGVGDLTLVMGYPSQTRKHIPAFALDRIVNHDTQLRADALKAKIDFLDSCRQRATGVSRSGYDVRISKLRNVYLRSMGEIQGVKATGLVAKKLREDQKLQQWIDSSPQRQQRYGTRLIERMDSVYARVTVYNHMDEAFDQLVGSGAGIIPFAGKFEKLVAIDRAKRKTRARDMAWEITAIRRNVREFFPSISMTEDCGMMKTVLPFYLRAVPRSMLPQALSQPVDMDRLYATSLLTDSARLEQFLAESIDKGTASLSTDTLYRICLDIYINRVQRQTRAAMPWRRLNTLLYNTYMRARSEMRAGSPEPYDANHTLRFSAGRVMDIGYMDEMLARTDTVTPKFRRLLSAAKERVMACFTTNAETAAGNSGSAVLNARGELVGVNFDRTAESTFSIYRNDPQYMRNIVVSTDYIVWVIRHLSRSQYILAELGAR